MITKPQSGVGLLILVVTLSAHSGLAGDAGGGVPFDLQNHIDQAIRSGTKSVVVPPGRYRVAPKNRQHLLLRDLANIEIVAQGVEMICTETTRALTISRCTNLTIRGLTIDYDPLPFTQGRIIGMSADKRIHEIELFRGYPEAGSARYFKYEVFCPDTRTLRCGDHYPQKMEILDSRHLRVVNPSGNTSDLEQVGDLAVMGAEFAPHGSLPHAVECDHNTNLRLEEINLFASNCFGFLENNCDGSTYFRCRIDRRPPGSDVVQRADPRLRSLDADAFHSKHASKGPSYLECSARFMGDDAINICGDYHLVMATEGTELRVLAKHDLNIQPGDPVELVTYEGRRLPNAQARSIHPAGASTDEERAFLARQRMDEGLRTARGGSLTRAFAVILDREVAMPRGSLIGSANRVGNGFAVKNCVFGWNRSRGILVKGSHGEVSGNRIENSWMSAILVAPEYWWLEAGSSRDLVISNNTITGCKHISIRVEAAGGDGEFAPAGAHQNVKIIGNTISQSAMPGILVTSTSQLTINENSFDFLSAAREMPQLWKQPGIQKMEPVVKINCAP
jgi:parallel beta-helix repeat protein